jgi:hypothetical protein
MTDWQSDEGNPKHVIEDYMTVREAVLVHQGVSRSGDGV